jgi:hypothetical protein
MGNLGAPWMNALHGNAKKLRSFAPLVVEHRRGQHGEGPIPQRLVVTNDETQRGRETQYGVSNRNVPDDALDELAAERALANQQAVRAKAATLAPVRYVPRIVPRRARQNRKAVFGISAPEVLSECLPDVLRNSPVEPLPID